MRVYHMSGAGNDFAVVDARKLSLDLEETAIRLCKQLGTDGFMALDTAQEGDFRLHFYNPDGLRGEMCGNGARCICRFAYDRGVAGETMQVQTDAGAVYGQRLTADCYRVQLNLPSVAEPDAVEGCSYVELGDPGVPHCLTRVPGLSWDMAEALREKGQQLRHHKAFPKGANVTFYEELTPGLVRVLTYERGVEDYTLACGTGCSSLAVALHLQGKLPGGVLTCQNKGGILTVTLEEQAGALSAIYLEGPTAYVGEYDL